ncbi:MAG: hypothetical protein AAFX76_04650 [Planctomycetota bacterium]
MSGPPRRPAGTRPSHAGRDNAEFLLAMARYLDPAGRSLVERVYRDGATPTDLARLSKASPRTVQSRLNRQIERINSPEFRFVVAHLSVLPRNQRAAMRRFYLEGRGLRDTARLTGRTLHETRKLRLRLDAELAARMQQWSAVNPGAQKFKK